MNLAHWSTVMASEAELKWLALVSESGDYKAATGDCYPNAVLDTIGALAAVAAQFFQLVVQISHRVLAIW